MSLKELEEKLLALSPAEKEQAIEILKKSLNNPWQGIQKTPNVCGGDACIAGTRIPVWVLVSFRHQGSTDSELLSFYPHLKAADLVNAWNYAAAYAGEIEEAIIRNQEA